MVIDLDRDRRQPFRETNALLQRLFYFLVIERVRRAVDQATAIGDGHATPTLKQLQHARCTSVLRRRYALGADRSRMRQVFLRDLGLVGGPRGFDCLRAPRRRLPPRRARRRARRTAPETFRSAPGNRRAIPSPYRWRSGRRQ